MPSNINFAAVPSGPRKWLVPEAAGALPRRGADTTELDHLRRLARIVVAGALVLPPSAVDQGPTLCLFRRTTGIPCPNCGLARSWTATAHGQFRRGFRMHPLGPPALIAAVLLAIMPGAWLVRLKARASHAAPMVASAWLITWFVRLVRNSASRDEQESDGACQGSR